MVVVASTSCLRLSQPPCHSHTTSPRSDQQQPNTKDTNKITVCVERSLISPSSIGHGLVGSRVFVVSDLHTDYAENMSWVKRLSAANYKTMSFSLPAMLQRRTVTFPSQCLSSRTDSNMSSSCRGIMICGAAETKRIDYLDSLEKLDKLLDKCGELGVQTNPTVIEDFGYHSSIFLSFDKEKDITNVRVPSLEMACKDFHACKWKESLSNDDTSLAEYFDALNERNQDAIQKIQGTCSQIITFSHFVPRSENND